MLIALFTATLTIVALYHSPKLRNLTGNKILKSVYHILGIFLIINIIPSAILMPLGASTDTAELTGRLFAILGIPTLIFVGVKKFRSRKPVVA